MIMAQLNDFDQIRIKSLKTSFWVVTLLGILSIHTNRLMIKRSTSSWRLPFVNSKYSEGDEYRGIKEIRIIWN